VTGRYASKRNRVRYRRTIIDWSVSFRRLRWYTNKIKKKQLKRRKRRREETQTLTRKTTSECWEV
jgi:hypothetical protein